MADYPIKSPRKLIEVALPLDKINLAAARVVTSINRNLNERMQRSQAPCA